MPDGKNLKYLDAAETSLRRAWPTGEVINHMEVYSALSLVIAYLRKEANDA